MKVLICGSRDWLWAEPIERELRKLPPRSIIVHGAAPGADSLADSLAKQLGFEVRPYPADWTAHGRSAGPIRNANMLKREHTPEEPIDLVLAFSKDFVRSQGTRDMVNRSKRVGLQVECYSV